MADGKQVFKWVGIGCGVFMLLVCIIGGSCAACVYNMTAPPAEAGHAFLGSVRTGNDADALRRMSASYQGTHDLPTFSANVAMLPALRSNTDATFANRNVNNGLATLEGTLTTAAGDVPIVMTLSPVGEAWQVDSVIVQGVPLP